MVEPTEPLLKRTADPDPLVQFGRWFDDAARVMTSPEAMAVASADAQGRPSARMVLLKAWGEEGFVFHTNYDSRKGRELIENPHAALLFYWEPIGRQVRIEGPVERTDGRESDAYFLTRPRGGQISAYASHQSQAIEDRGGLDARVEMVQADYAGREVPRPAWWGGLRVSPRVFEFWQNREDRLHDRLRYTGGSAGWEITRLQP
ncbi:MAG: pyridoxamine 5'-phosphate oxidase [Acidimicrobiales bacterium]|nr:pyridoxamine 5'-phosphate oxidase [Acidimicrobiales bacterium]